MLFNRDGLRFTGIELVFLIIMTCEHNLGWRAQTRIRRLIGTVKQAHG